MVSAHKIEMILKWHEDGVTVTKTADLGGRSHRHHPHRRQTLRDQTGATHLQ